MDQSYAPSLAMLYWTSLANASLGSKKTWYEHVQVCLVQAACACQLNMGHTCGSHNT